MPSLLAHLPEVKNVERAWPAGRLDLIATAGVPKQGLPAVNAALDTIRPEALPRRKEAASRAVGQD
jgi:hypothetical protein